MNYIKLFLLGTIFVQFGCGKKTVLSQDELFWLGDYVVGDTIVFRSGKGALDSIQISGITLGYDEYDPILKHGYYLPQGARVEYTSLIDTTAKQHLVYLKKPRPDSVSFYISFNCGYSGDVYADNINSRFQRGDTLRFDCQFGDGTHYWNKRGLVKHIDQTGTVWKRVN